MSNSSVPTPVLARGTRSVIWWSQKRRHGAAECELEAALTAGRPSPSHPSHRSGLTRMSKGAEDSEKPSLLREIGLGVLGGIVLGPLLLIEPELQPYGLWVLAAALLGGACAGWLHYRTRLARALAAVRALARGARRRSGGPDCRRARDTIGNGSRRHPPAVERRGWYLRRGAKAPRVAAWARGVDGCNPAGRRNRDHRRGGSRVPERGTRYLDSDVAEQAG